MNHPFRPSPKSTLRINAATAGSPVYLGDMMSSGGGSQVRVRNRGAVEAYVEFGASGILATVPGTSTPGSEGIAPGGVEIFTLQQSERYVAVNVESGTPALEVTIGTGD